MIFELIRPILKRLFWRRWRPVAAAMLLFLVIAVIARAASNSHAQRPSQPARAAATATPATATPAAAGPTPSSPAATPASSSAGAVAPAARSAPATTTRQQAGSSTPAAALPAARRFMTGWVGNGPGWAARLRPLVTAQLAAQLSHTSNAGNPATAVTGAATVTSQAPGTVSLSVPTDAGPALLTMRLAGGRWLAADVMLARTGN